jgi:hypothetical protein
MTETERIIESLSDEEMLVWVTLFGTLPPVRMPIDRVARLRRVASRERVCRIVETVIVDKSGKLAREGLPTSDKTEARGGLAA